MNSFFKILVIPTFSLFLFSHVSYSSSDMGNNVNLASESEIMDSLFSLVETARHSSSKDGTSIAMFNKSFTKSSPYIRSFKTNKKTAQRSSSDISKAQSHFLFSVVLTDDFDLITGIENDSIMNSETCKKIARKTLKCAFKGTEHVKSITFNLAPLLVKIHDIQFR